MANETINKIVSERVAMMLADLLSDPRLSNEPPGAIVRRAMVCVEIQAEQRGIAPSGAKEENP